MVDFSGIRNAITEAAKPNAEAQAVVDKMSQVTEKALASAKEATDALLAKMGKGASLLKGTAEEIADQQPTARETAAQLANARVQSIAEMTKNNGTGANTQTGTYWREKFNRGQEIAAETTASPAGALPPG